MIKVLVCGEGRHDVGESKRPSGEEGTTDEDGWLQVFLRRLVPDETTFVVVGRRDLVLQRRQQSKYQPLPQGHGKKALLSKIRAEAGDYDLVVFMADADSNKLGDWRRRRSDILDGFDRVPGPNGVPCVPMSTSESWLLADGQAWRGVGLTKLTLLPKKPEKIWGFRDDRRGNHPHQVFRRVCDAAKVRDSRKIRVHLADSSNLETLRSACPTSFGGLCWGYGVCGGVELTGAIAIASTISS